MRRVGSYAKHSVEEVRNGLHVNIILLLFFILFAFFITAYKRGVYMITTSAEIWWASPFVFVFVQELLDRDDAALAG